LPTDSIQYDILAREALRQVVHDVLEQAQREGLPGEHHFFVTFATQAPGVVMSDELRSDFPDEMTIVLQHQYWDLEVSRDRFAVKLAFGGVPRELVVPFKAVTGFFDPSVQFGLQFAPSPEEGTGTPAPAPAPAGETAGDTMPPVPGPAEIDTSDEAGDGETQGEVVSLDAFRKK
jgi:hypothetical protein